MQKFGGSEKLAYLCSRKRGKTPPGKGGGRTSPRESDLWKGLHRQETVHKTSEANRRFYNGSKGEYGIRIPSVCVSFFRSVREQNKEEKRYYTMKSLILAQDER